MQRMDAGRWCRSVVSVGGVGRMKNESLPKSNYKFEVMKCVCYVQWVVLSLNTFAENRVPTRSSIFTLYLQHHKMTTPRRLLGDIDPNITSRSELSPYLRGVIAGRAQEGGKPTLIAQGLKVPKSTVFTTIKRSVIREVRQIPKIS